MKARVLLFDAEVGAGGGVSDVCTEVRGVDRTQPSVMPHSNVTPVMSVRALLFDVKAGSGGMSSDTAARDLE